MVVSFCCCRNFSWELSHKNFWNTGFAVSECFFFFCFFAFPKDVQRGLFFDFFQASGCGKSKLCLGAGCFAIVLVGFFVLGMTMKRIL